ncbi:PEP-CTERM sorting domain-containing protein [Adhaeretor mobilis]|uniref:Ice-binding protein C-terminal domain-containing protein n=1 Tax=Adhaeretor mobilis TaxID=1930276 RepID=A0A517MT28_9BACT|nr:PEP-CTERM sorting domain-containing protein [Adhaeretor mobilis]QDS98029.1 hypothetical protein HG15A2_12990 [Adhaeretor mobilis]
MSLSIALALLAPSVHADVIGNGDVTPVIDNGSGTDVPDLPQFGGAVTGGDLVVGGTGMQVGGTDFGTVVVDVPQDTDPLTATNVTIGGIFDGYGLIQVVGAGSSLRVQDRFIVGEEGQGVLSIFAGAQVRTNVDDTGAPSGMMGTRTDPDMAIGEIEGSQGFVTVDGLGSLLRNNTLAVGHGGFGRLDITNFARVQTDDEAIIGNEEVSGGTGTPQQPGNGSVYVSGRGTRWNIGPGTNTGTTGDLIVGNEGRGLLEIREEAYVRVVHDAEFGVESGSFGEVVISDQGSLLWILNDTQIGHASDETARSTVHVENDGLFRVDGNFDVGVSGRINLAGGIILTPTVTNTGVIRGDGRIEGDILNAGGDIRTAAGIANIREQMLVTGSVVNSGIVESIGGEMEFEELFTNNVDGQIFGKDAILRFRGNLVDNGEMYIENTVVEAPLLSVGSLTVGAASSFVLGDLAMSGISELSMHIDDDDDHSRLAMTGDAMLGGALRLTIDSGYNPQDGDTFEIMTADSIIGTFDIEPLSIDPDFSYVVDYQSDAVYINVVAGNTNLVGDYNGDGMVDSLDLDEWQIDFGMTDGSDGDGDSDSDGFDFLLWQQQFGVSAIASGGAATGAVPEPSSLVLALGLIVGAGLRRKR